MKTIRFALAMLCMLLGTLGLATLALIWCYSASSFGGHLGFALQLLFAAICVGSGYLAHGDEE